MRGVAVATVTCGVTLLSNVNKTITSSPSAPDSMPPVTRSRNKPADEPEEEREPQPGKKSVRWAVPEIWEPAEPGWEERQHSRPLPNRRRGKPDEAARPKRARGGKTEAAAAADDERPARKTRNRRIKDESDAPAEPADGSDSDAVDPEQAEEAEIEALVEEHFDDPPARSTRSAGHHGSDDSVDEPHETPVKEPTRRGRRKAKAEPKAATATEPKAEATAESAEAEAEPAGADAPAPSAIEPVDEPKPRRTRQTKKAKAPAKAPATPRKRATRKKTGTDEADVSADADTSADGGAVAAGRVQPTESADADTMDTTDDANDANDTTGTADSVDNTADTTADSAGAAEAGAESSDENGAVYEDASPVVSSPKAGLDLEPSSSSEYSDAVSVVAAADAAGAGATDAVAAGAVSGHVETPLDKSVAVSRPDTPTRADGAAAARSPATPATPATPAAAQLPVVAPSPAGRSPLAVAVATAADLRAAAFAAAAASTASPAAGTASTASTASRAAGTAPTAAAASTASPAPPAPPAHAATAPHSPGPFADIEAEAESELVQAGYLLASPSPVVANTSFPDSLGALMDSSEISMLLQAEPEAVLPSTPRSVAGSAPRRRSSVLPATPSRPLADEVEAWGPKAPTPDREDTSDISDALPDGITEWELEQRQDESIWEAAAPAIGLTLELDAGAHGGSRPHTPLIKFDNKENKLKTGLHSPRSLATLCGLKAHVLTTVSPLRGKTGAAAAPRAAGGPCLVPMSPSAVNVEMSPARRAQR
ncbi:uncharacterized protein V1510DRAFT_1136 [Dipodascopsis tothii]|uniref:uncharacterized protein n=1 Tax=Dipodascopsis tothii TaxID=44089 RepID=UPI0034CE6961